jgi:excinuclease UvrABC nuclease subunit
MSTESVDGHAPSVVSVYQYYDNQGRCLYVGVTARGIRRTAEHAETKSWWPLCAGCGIEHFATREEALERERQLITRHHPPYNTVHNDRKAESRSTYEAVKPEVRLGRLAGASLRDQREAYMALPKKVKKLTPCVSCRVRPTGGRPMCDACFADHKRKKYEVAQ